jgi:hypothetical protein
MQRENEMSTMESVLRLLYRPVPYLPEMSFLVRGRSEQRKQQALARLKLKAPNERKVRGNLELFSKGKCRICGHDVEITESTWIFGDIKDGVVAEMTLVENGSSFNAKRIVII